MGNRENVYPAGPYQGVSRYGMRNRLYSALDYNTRDASGRIFRAQIVVPAAIATRSFQSPPGAVITPANSIDYPVIDGSQCALENVTSLSFSAVQNSGFQLLLNAQVVSDFTVPLTLASTAAAGSAITGATLRTVQEIEFDLIRFWNFDATNSISYFVQIATGRARIIQVQA